MMKHIILISFLAVLGFSCAKDKTDDQKIQEFIAANNLTMQTTPEGVYYSIDSAGTGTTYPNPSDMVYADYKLLLTDGTQVGEAATPDTFFLAKTLPGIAAGLKKFTKGAVGKFIIPSTLGLGAQSLGAIPANSILYFKNVKVVNFEAGDDDSRIKRFLAQKGWNNYKVTPEGLYYVIDSVGSGTDMPTLTSIVTVRYTGYLLNGTVFDRNTAGYSTSLGSVIKGWQIGIPLFKKRGTGKIIMPSTLGYGSTAAGSIPADSPLVFEIALDDFK